MAESNVSDFFFTSSAVEAGTFRVVSFTGDERISALYRFAIRLQGESDEVDLAALLDKPATFTIHAPGGTGHGPRNFHGIVSGVSMLDRDAARVNFEVELMPRLFRALLCRNHRIFQDISIPDVIKQVLEASGFTQDDFKFNLTNSYSTRAYVTQYDETDLDFIHRLAESQGIAYSFGQAEEFEFVEFSDGGRVADKQTSADIGEFVFRANTGLAVGNEETVGQFAPKASMVTGKFSLKDYNYKAPTDALLSEFSDTGPDKYEDYRYPGGYFSSDLGDRLAKQRQQSNELERKTILGLGGCRAFCAGYQFSLVDHFNPEYDREYTLTRVKHSGSDFSLRTGGGSTPSYQNEFECIPADIIYRPPMRTPKPIVAGFQCAVCTGPAGENLFMDDLGRTKVKFPWDRSDTKEDHTSCFLRVSQPYAGPKHGIQFNPLVGDEVIVQFENGDPDRPLITGRVYNPDKMPPLKPADRIQNVIYTPYQHRLLFDDKAATIVLKTGGNEVMTMSDGAKEDGNFIKLATADTHTLKLAKGGVAAKLSATADDPGAVAQKVAKDQATAEKLRDAVKDTIQGKTAQEIVASGVQGAVVDLVTSPLELPANGIEAKTEGGHTFFMDDWKFAIGLKTGLLGHSFSMLDLPSPQDLVKGWLLDEKWKIGIFAKTFWGNFLELNDRERRCELSTQKKHHVFIEDKANRIEIAISQGVGPAHGHRIQLNGDDETVNIESKNGHIISIDDAQNSITIEGKSGKNKIVIFDDVDQIEIETKQGGSLMLTAPDGVMKLKAKDIEISADNHVWIEGKDVKSEATVSNKILGQTVNSEAKAINTVKGGMVQLNP